MTLDQSQYAAVILNQFLDNASPTYLIPIEPDAVYKLADTGGEKLAEEKKSRYLQAIGKLKRNLGIFKQLENFCICAILDPILYFQYTNWHSFQLAPI